MSKTSNEVLDPDPIRVPVLCRVMFEKGMAQGGKSISNRDSFYFQAWHSHSPLGICFSGARTLWDFEKKENEIWGCMVPY